MSIFVPFLNSNLQAGIIRCESLIFNYFFSLRHFPQAILHFYLFSQSSAKQFYYCFKPHDSYAVSLINSNQVNLKIDKKLETKAVKHRSFFQITLYLL